MLQVIGLALQGLALKCHVFDDALRKQIEGTLDEETSKMWTMFLVNSKKYEDAKEFTKLFPDFEDSDLDFVEDLIQTNKSNPFHLPGCRACGCSDEEIMECHPKLIRNKNGEASNTPAFHITDDKLEKDRLMEYFSGLSFLLFICVDM